MKKLFITFVVAVFSLLSSACSTSDIGKTIKQLEDVKDTVETAQQAVDTGAGLIEQLQSKGSKKVFQTKVFELYDGDTAVIEYNGKRRPIRFLCIDAPEVKKHHWLAKESTELARKYLKGKTVTIQLSKKNPPEDKYGRLLGYIWIDKNTMYQDIALANGLAIVRYVYNPDTEYETRFKKIEAQAKESKKGVWAVEGYADNQRGYDMSVIKK